MSKLRGNQNSMPERGHDYLKAGVYTLGGILATLAIAMNSCEATQDDLTCTPSGTHEVTSDETLNDIAAGSYPEQLQAANPGFTLFETLPLGAEIVTITCSSPASE